MEMREQTYLLIPTADELTWKFDRPVLFLGEWCRLFIRKEIWNNMNAVVAKPYGIDKKIKDSDWVEAKFLESKYFQLLCQTLNRVHRVNYSERFWRILLGSWFERYSTLILNRVKTLETCLQQYNINGVIAYSQEEYSLATKDSYHATLASNDDVWNHNLTLKILNSFQDVDIPREVVASVNSDWYQIEHTGAKNSLDRRIKEIIYRAFRKVALSLVRESDAMIIGSYLSLKAELMLQVALKQFPKWLVAQKLDLNVKPDAKMRRELTREIKIETNNQVESVFQDLLFQLLPVCYLEGFAQLSEKAKEQHWPSKPKFIFSSNNFEYDEIFKLWAAEKVLRGTPLIYGQHGNNYGTHRYLFPTIEETVCDKFLTWGWGAGLVQYSPAFLFRNAGKKYHNSNSSGNIVLIETHVEHRFRTWDTSHEFLKYFEEQERFVGNLERRVASELIVRLPISSQQSIGFESARWQNFDPSISIEPGFRPIEDLVSESRLVVHSYDSTGMLETLSRNIPTLVFWQNNLDHLRESVLADYEMLIEVGIVHLTPESAAKKTNRIWDDVESWWQSSEVQRARNEFCSRYARTSTKPIRDLKKILLENV